jgi:hypothetical protein
MTRRIWCHQIPTLYTCQMIDNNSTACCTDVDIKDLCVLDVRPQWTRNITTPRHHPPQALVAWRSDKCAQGHHHPQLNSPSSNYRFNSNISRTSKRDFQNQSNSLQDSCISVPARSTGPTSTFAATDSASTSQASPFLGCWNRTLTPSLCDS